MMGINPIYNDPCFEMTEIGGSEVTYISVKITDCKRFIEKLNNSRVSNIPFFLEKRHEKRVVSIKFKIEGG